MSVMDGAIIATVSTPELAVVTKTLSRRFGDLIAVANVSMAVSHGEIFGLIGPNGAGKSRLIKMLTTLLPPSSGTARVAGFDIVVQAAEVRRRIGYVPQLLSVDRSLTGYENMLLSARLYAIPRRERAQRIAEALSAMNLTEAAGRLVHHYSGGMIRALEIAQSMLHRPQVLMMDEPTVGLDPMARRVVRDRVRALRATLGMTMLVTTHDMGEADELCDRIALMHNGRIEVTGSPAELKGRLSPGRHLTTSSRTLSGSRSNPAADIGKRSSHGRAFASIAEKARCLSFPIMVGKSSLSRMPRCASCATTQQSS
jgi:ABC-2 type transport system ATP-binding protein